MPVPPAPFQVLTPDRPADAPFLFSSPHSGRHYPAAFRHQARLGRLDLRRSEDCFVDELVRPVTGLGAPLIHAAYGRAYVDLNRDPRELDPLLIDPCPPAVPLSATERVAAGLGVIPRVVASGMPIYARRIPLDEAMERLATIHRPYHERVQDSLERLRRRFGWAVLVDCHSMPSLIAADLKPGAQIVLGDRYGTACAPAIVDVLEDSFRDEGFWVTRNDPYAGGTHLPDITVVRPQVLPGADRPAI